MEFGCSFIQTGNVWAVADPDYFPQSGRQPGGGGGAPTYYLAKFSSKLHENKENSTEGCQKFVYVDPPLMGKY